MGRICGMPAGLGHYQSQSPHRGGGHFKEDRVLTDRISRPTRLVPIVYYDEKGKDWSVMGNVNKYSKLVEEVRKDSERGSVGGRKVSQVASSTTSGGGKVRTPRQVSVRAASRHDLMREGGDENNAAPPRSSGLTYALGVKVNPECAQDKDSNLREKLCKLAVKHEDIQKEFDALKNKLTNNDDINLKLKFMRILLSFGGDFIDNDRLNVYKSKAYQSNLNVCANKNDSDVLGSVKEASLKYGLAIEPNFDELYKLGCGVEGEKNAIENKENPIFKEYLDDVRKNIEDKHAEFIKILDGN